MMNDRNTKYIWIWLHGDLLNKAIYTVADQTLVIYNELDEIVLKRKGITPADFNKLQVLFASIGAKRVDNHKEPFTYL
jgi:hypothetical protein